MSISKLEYDGLCASQVSENEFFVIIENLKRKFSIIEIKSLFESHFKSSSLGKFDPTIFDIEFWEDYPKHGWLFDIFKELNVGNFDQGVLAVNGSMNAYISAPRITVNKIVIEEISASLSKSIKA